MDISNTGSDIKYTTFTDISVGNVSFVPDGKNVTLFSGAISTTAISTGTIQSILIRPGTGTTLGVQAFTDDILSVRFNGSEFATITLTDFPPNDNHLISKTVSLPINYQNTGTITIVGGPIKATPSATGSYSFNVELSSIQNIDGKTVTFTQNALTGNTTTIYQSPTVIIKDASVAAPLNNKIYGGISQEVGRFALQAGGENRILTGLTIEATGSFIYTLSDIVDASSIELWDAETNTKIDATTSIINDNFIFFN